MLGPGAAAMLGPGAAAPAARATPGTPPPRTSAVAARPMIGVRQRRFLPALRGAEVTVIAPVWSYRHGRTRRVGVRHRVGERLRVWREDRGTCAALPFLDGGKGKRFP